VTSNLDELIRGALDDIARDAPELGPPPPPEPIVGATVSLPSTHFRRRVLQVAALAVVALGVAAVVAVRLSRDPTAPGSDQPSVSATLPTPSTVSSETTSAATTVPPASASTTIDRQGDVDRRLSEIESSLPIPDLDALQGGDWLVATWLPPGYDFAYAQGLVDSSRSVVYRNGTTGERLLLSVRPGDAVGLPDTDGWDLDVDANGVGSARLQTDGVAIGVTPQIDPRDTALDAASQLDTDVLVRLVEGLSTEPEASLPTPVLRMDPTRTVTGSSVVATLTFKGLPIELRAQGTNGYYCLESGFGSSCPIRFDAMMDVMSKHGGGGAGAIDGEPTMDVTSYGIARPDVARIEFEFADGTTMAAVPEDLSGTFDVRFWLIAEQIELDDPIDASPGAPLPQGILRTIAYDEDGNILAVDDGPQPGPGHIERLAVGSNVMLGAAGQLAGLGFVVDAVQDRQFHDMVDVLRGVQPRLGTVVMIDGAVNGPISPTDLENAMAILADVGHVIVVTTTADREFNASNNEMVRALPDRYPDVTVADWATEADTCLETCLYEDHIHLRPEGQARYAQLIADVIAGARN